MDERGQSTATPWLLWLAPLVAIVIASLIVTTVPPPVLSYGAPGSAYAESAAAIETGRTGAPLVTPPIAGLLAVLVGVGIARLKRSGGNT